MEILPQIKRPSKGVESPERSARQLVQELMQKSLQLGRFSLFRLCPRLASAHSGV